MKDYTRTCGLDLGDKYSWVYVVNEEGELLEECRVPTTLRGLRRAFGSGRCMRIALEVGTHSPWVSRVLESWGHEVLVANARKLRFIFNNESKSDKLDAKQLAKVARLDPDLLYPVRHRGEQAQHDFMLLKARDGLVRTRTDLVNEIRGLAKSFGIRLRKCSTPHFHRMALQELPPAFVERLRPLIDMAESLTKAIRSYDKQIEQCCEERYPETELLRGVAGVGPLTALAFVLTIEDPHRFKKSRQLGAYVGLRPRRDQSGERDMSMRITKAGSSYLRRLLVQAAQYILGPFGLDSTLRRWGLSLVQRGGPSAKKRAVIAVARKPAVLLHRLWVTGEVYAPFYAHDGAGSPNLDVCSG